MRKIITILLAYFMIMTPVKVFAENNVSVEAKIIGEIKKGSNIEILIDVKNVDNLYAASIDFTYDTKQLGVESIKSTEYISKNIDNIMELGGEVDKNGDIASYSFTFLGDVDGLMGSGTLVKINAKVLNNDKLSITKENMKIKLIQKSDGTVKNYDYKFIGYNGQDDSNSNLSNDSNAGSSNNNVGSNGTSNEKNDNSQGSDNKKVNSDSNNSSNNGNEVSKDENLNKNNDENNSNGESSPNSKDNNQNKDKNSNSNDSKSEIYKNNLANVVYVLIAIGVVGGVGYYYYKFRKNKNKDN